MDLPITFSQKTVYKGSIKNVNCHDNMLLVDIMIDADIPVESQCMGKDYSGDTTRLNNDTVINANEYKALVFSQGSSSAAK